MHLVASPRSWHRVWWAPVRVCRACIGRQTCCTVRPCSSRTMYCPCSPCLPGTAYSPCFVLDLPAAHSPAALCPLRSRPHGRSRSTRLRLRHTARRSSPFQPRVYTTGAGPAPVKHLILCNTVFHAIKTYCTTLDLPALESCSRVNCVPSMVQLSRYHNPSTDWYCRRRRNGTASQY